MKLLQAASLYAIYWLLGLLIGLDDTVESTWMQGYAIGLTLLSLGILTSRVVKGFTSFLSCYAAITFAPVWFLYLEAIFEDGDAWLLPYNQVIHTLSYASFFLMICNLFYGIKMPRKAIKWHDRTFNREIKSSYFASIGIAIVCLTFIVVMTMNDWNWELTKLSFLAGRSGGTGLTRRTGLGGIEVLLQPLEFVCASVPTIAALSWVSFPKERSAPLIPRTLVTICAIFIVFVNFLNGSRGLLATYLAGPIAVWFTFGSRKIRKIPFILISLLLFSNLIAVWEFQKVNRSNLLDNSFFESASFDPTKTHRDNNLYIFTLNHIYRPTPYPFEGFYDLYVLLVNPIPRFIWNNKPKGIQEDEYTFKTPSGPESQGPKNLGTASLSRSIVGDGFRMMHYFGISIFAMLVSVPASMWDSLGKRYMSSKLYFVIHSSWIFWMLWGFRAGFAFITGMYTVLGAYLLAHLVSRLGKPKVFINAKAH